MSKKAALPIQYIIALIFGIVILAVLGYWLTAQSTKAIGSSGTTECSALKTTFCQQYSITAFKIEPSISFPTGCSKPSDDECKTLLRFCRSAATKACEGKQIDDVCETTDEWGGIVKGTCKILGGDTCYCV